MRKIRIAQIGMNQYSHGKQVFDALKSRPDLFEIAGYALVEDERETCAGRLKYFAGYPELTLEEILTDPTIEAVTVETDEVHLLKYARLAAEHGKQIHMEKPGSPSLADFEALIETVRAKGLLFHIGYMYRYNPVVADAIRQVREGRLGEIHSVEAQMNCRLGEKARAWLSTLPGGMTFYLGCHLIDLVLQLQGEPLRVLPLNKSTGESGSDSTDFGMAVLEYPRGHSFIKTTATEWGGFRRRQLVISGSKGTIEIKPLETVDPEKTSRIFAERRQYDESDTWHTDGRFCRSEPWERYGVMMEAFAAMVRGETENPYTYDYELTLFRTILACAGQREEKIR